MRQDSPGDGGSSSGGPGDGASSSVGGAADAAAAVTVGSIACVPAAAAVAAPAPAASPASPASPLGAVLPPDVRHSSDPPTAASEPPVEAHQTRSQWRRQVHRELRDRLVNGMFEELQRIMGVGNVRHLRQCATRYESFVWKKSASQDQYKSKLERRIESLRRQPPQPESPFAASTQIPSQGGEEGDAAWALLATPHRHRSSRSSSSRRSSSRKHSSSGRRSSRRSSSAPSSVPSSPFASAASSPRGSLASPLSGTQIWRDEQYFSRLRAMKTKYRDEVALVFRELCRVNTVIQHSASLRRHESNNLGDFLANLKKIIYLLEQQPDEMSGMIPPRKRTLEYLDVVESHIQRKVLPILHRLRHTYSTILRPIVLNYLRNCTRHTRRL